MTVPHLSSITPPLAGISRSTAQTVCDLVLLSWNHLEETLPCLESLFASTTLPCRLFIVDNGSEPETRKALAQVQPQGSVHTVTLLQNETNLGFPRGMNRGIAASSAPYVCILNNDLRFTAGWLEELLAIAKTSDDIGLVNPGSSTFGSHPPKGMALEAYAQACARRFKGIYTEVGMCIGFCMLIKRAVIDKIGGLTEEVERIFFEDEDYSMRAQRAGFCSVVADGAYVYHAEHKTVKKMPEREALFTRNQNWCNERWGKRLRIAWPVPEKLHPAHPRLKEYLEELVGWARRRNHVYAIVPGARDTAQRELFNAAGLVPHADVHWIPVPATIAPLASLTCILQR